MSARPHASKSSVPAPARPSPWAACAAAWAMPGAGHLLLGCSGRALVVAAMLLPMYGIGLWLGGRVFPLAGEPLVILAGASQWMIGVPRLVSLAAGAGVGEVTAAAYEYGNTFLIAAGLLNTLVVFDAFDIATGRKS
jgi:hypothetical protein